MDSGTTLPDPAPFRKVPDAVLGLLLEELRELRALAGTLATHEQVDDVSCQLREFVCESRARERSKCDAAVSACLDLHDFAASLRDAFAEDPNGKDKDMADFFDCLLLRIEDHLATMHIRPLGVRVGSPFDPARMRIIRTTPCDEGSRISVRFTVSRLHRDGWLHQDPASPAESSVLFAAHVDIYT